MTRANTMHDVFDRYIPEPMSGCWLWLGRLSDKGYAIIEYQGKTRKVSQLIKDIPEGKEPHHKCRVRSCINPDHIVAVTHQENIWDSDTGKNMKEREGSKTHCPRGHEYTAESTYYRKGELRLGHRECRICMQERRRARHATDGI